MGSERISAKNGTALLLGRFPATLLASPSEMPNLNVQDIRNQSNKTVTNAEKEVTNVHDILDVQAPPMSSIVETDKANYSHSGRVDCYYFHPDHLGSSSYITNLDGVVSQHMEYLPFGETMVDEHLNSRNSPFKYNGKEFDEETGNYYYGARYYDPKWSIFVSVDPLAEQTMDAYGYCYQNPINLVDPDGMSAVDPGDDIYVYKNQKTQVVHTGDNTPNRLFVQDASANKNTENRKAHNGAYFEQQMIPSSSYSEADYKAQGFMGSSQFDKDRNSYVFHAGDYSDKNMAQRLGKSMGDDYVTQSDLSILLMPRASKGGNSQKSDFVVTEQGVAIPQTGKYKVSKDLIENPHKPPGTTSYGKMEGGKYKETLRIDPPTPANKKGPNYSHYHKDGKGKHYSPNGKDKNPGF